MLFADSASDSALGGGVIAFVVIIYLVLIVVFVAIYAIPHYVVVKKAGYNPWLSLLIFVPLVGIVMMYLFAFADWPALRGNRPLGFVPPPPFPPGPPGYAPVAEQPSPLGTSSYGAGFGDPPAGSSPGGPPPPPPTWNP